MSFVFVEISHVPPREALFRDRKTSRGGELRGQQPLDLSARKKQPQFQRAGR